MLLVLNFFYGNYGLTIILLQVTIMTLSEEKTPLISLLKPLLWQLNSSHLKPKEGDSETARSFKEALSESLSERCVFMSLPIDFFFPVHIQELEHFRNYNSNLHNLSESELSH